ncbi:general substrate transporter [Myxozyma melibiosi]|uniref:General substrate transporter n=1 Tax=Myxozyma melibiosi TaxID=54550 RepID=A0ABR1FD32_9ASCO
MNDSTPHYRDNDPTPNPKPVAQFEREQLLQHIVFDEIESKYGGVYIWLVACAAALGGLLFGYDLTVVSGVLVMIGDDFGAPLTSSEQELLASITSIGAFLGALIAGFLLDRIGRKAVIGLGALVFAVGSLLQAASYSVDSLLLGRFVVGLGIGEAAMVAPIYIAEIAPAQLRGSLVTVDGLAITGGEVVAAAGNIYFQGLPQHTGWRWAVGVAAVPAFLLFALCFIIPESPRTLIFKDKLDEAFVVTSKIYPHATAEEVHTKIGSIKSQFQRDAHLLNLSTAKQFELLFTDRANLRALIVACGLMAISQFSGSNGVFYYAPEIFGVVGFSDPIQVTVLVALTNFCFGLFALKYIDTVGRRKFLVSSMWGMPVCLVIVAFGLNRIPTAAEGTDPSTQVLTLSGIVVLLAVLGFIASYALALGIVPWQGNELFPMEVRSLGTMMLTLTCWSSNFVVTSTFLTLMEKLKPAGTFLLYALINFLGWIAVIFCYPEVSGLPLEDVKNVFMHGFGVKYSLKLQNERKLALIEGVLRDEGQVFS